MSLDAVEQMIVDALADERRTGRLANALRERAEANGRAPGAEELAGAVAFVREYVEQVPAYVRGGLEAARVAGRESEMRDVVDAASAYWLSPSDIIPDSLGLLGVLDDAYCTLTLMQGVSDRCEGETGRALFSRSLKAANLAVRSLIGEPAASQIDMHVGTQLKADSMTQMVHALTAIAARRGAFPIPGQDDLWGDARTEDIVHARLGGLGLA